MEEQYIDVRNTEEQYRRAVARFQKDKAVSPRNKQLLLAFVRDAALGKTIIGRAKKKIGPVRLHAYVVQLRPLIDFLKKDLDQVKQEDMEDFIEALETDKIRSRSRHFSGKNRRRGLVIEI